MAIVDDAVFVLAVGGAALDKTAQLAAYRPDNGSLSIVASWDDAIGEGFALHAGIAWVLSEGFELLRVEPGRGEPTAATALVAGEAAAMFEPVAIAGDEGDIWIATGFDRPGDSQPTRGTFMLWRVDRDRNAVTANVELDGSSYDVAVGDGSVWVSVADQDQVHQISPATGRVVVSVNAGRTPGALATSDGAIWVTNARDGTVSRIDTATLDVKPIEVGGIPSDVAFGQRGVWVLTRP